MQHKGYKITVFIDDKPCTRYALLDANTPIEKHWYIKDLLHRAKTKYPNATIEIAFEADDSMEVGTVSNEVAETANDETENLDGLELDFNPKA